MKLYEINENGYVEFIDRITHKEGGLTNSIEVFSVDAKISKVF